MPKVPFNVLKIESLFSSVNWNVDDFISEFKTQVEEISSVKKQEALERATIRLEVQRYFFT